MRIEILGSGGAISTPRPLCQCRVCSLARRRGVPYSRGGPSLFVHGPNALFDTPEDIKTLLNRSTVGVIAAGFYSHWHPDHVMGRRVWEELNQDWRHWPPQHQRTSVFVPEQVARDFRKYLATWDHLALFAKRGIIDLVELPDGESVTLGETSIRPFRLHEDYVYGFVLEEGGTRVLLVLDELHGWEPPGVLTGLDLAVLPMGIAEFDPLTGERRIPADHPTLKSEATFRDTLAVVRRLSPGRTVLTHVEEPDEVSYDDGKRLEEKLRAEGLDVMFAYDTLLIDV